MQREEEESIKNDLNQTKIRNKENILSRWKRDEDNEIEQEIPSELIIDSEVEIIFSMNFYIKVRYSWCK